MTEQEKMKLEMAKTQMKDAVDVNKNYTDTEKQMMKNRIDIAGLQTEAFAELCKMFGIK